MNGAIIGVSAQTQKYVDQVQKKWKLKFQLYSDVHTELASEVGTVVVKDKKPYFPLGIMSQPGVVVITKPTTTQEPVVPDSTTEEAKASEETIDEEEDESQAPRYGIVFHWTKNGVAGRIAGYDAWAKVIKPRLQSDNPTDFKKNPDQKLKSLGMKMRMFH